MRKEDDLHDDGNLEHELKLKGWNTDKMSINEFNIIHQGDNKNLVSNIKDFPKKLVKTIIPPKVHR